MNASHQNTSIADFYFGLLSNLSIDSKLDLITWLSQSLKKTEANVTSLLSLFGAYQGEESAEEIIDKIRKSRTFNRNTESL
jgi:hypothetical protein